MSGFLFKETEIENLKLIEPLMKIDERGYFVKFYEKSIFLENGVDLNSIEEMQTYSKRGVLRGLHFQKKKSQGKLVRVVSGEIFDVAVDLRRDSKTFGKWQSFYLSETNKEMLFIPPDFAHGFLVLSESATITYICNEAYYKEYDDGIIWNDDNLNINWPKLDCDYLISNRDKEFKDFNEYLRSL